MLNIKTINNKDYIAYGEYVLDSNTCKWININNDQTNMIHMTLEDLINGFKQDKNGNWYIKVTIAQPKPHQVTDTMKQKSSDES
jgi:hypothetical protein